MKSFAFFHPSAYPFEYPRQYDILFLLIIIICFFFLTNKIQYDKLFYCCIAIIIIRYTMSNAIRGDMGTKLELTNPIFFQYCQYVVFNLIFPFFLSYRDNRAIYDIIKGKSNNNNNLIPDVIIITRFFMLSV